MEKGDSFGLNEESSISIPRCGPIFVQDFISTPIRASVFEFDVFNELERLKAELGSEPTDLEKEDISVDELKIYSDEELVAEAIKIAFEQNNFHALKDLREDFKVNLEKITGRSDVQQCSSSVASDRTIV